MIPPHRRAVSMVDIVLPLVFFACFIFGIFSAAWRML